MTEWLAQQRLLQYAEDFARVAGVNVTPADLQFLTEDGVETIGSAMTRVERMRLQAALEGVTDGERE